MASNSKGLDPIKLAFGLVVIIGLLSLLGIGIAILVKVIQNDKKTTDNTPGVSSTPTYNSPLHIPPPPTLDPQDTRTSTYTEFLGILKQNVNLTADPCNDFWTYACGNIGTNPQSFSVLTIKNYQLMANQIANSGYVGSAPYPIQQAAHSYTQCVTATANWANIIANGSTIVKKVQDFQNIIGIPMPSIYNGSTKSLTPETLGSALGYLKGRAYTDTLVTLIVDTNWKRPDAAPGYSIFVDQSTLGYPNSYYQKPVAWADYQASYANQTFLQVSTIAKLLNPGYNPSVQDPIIRNDVNKVLFFEWSLANNYSTSDAVRRHYNRSYNQFSIADANATYSFINWTNYLNQLLVYAPPDVQNYVLNDTKFKFLIMEPGVLTQIQNDLNNAANAFVDVNTLINWLYIRLFQTNNAYIPVPKSSYISLVKKTKSTILSERPRLKAPTLPTFHPYDSQQDATGLNTECMNDNVFGIQYANARLFIDALYPNQKDRDVLRYNVAQFVTLVLDSFQSMLNQLGWMDLPTKQGAYAKISNLVKNIAYPDFITDNSALTSYYQNLTFALTDDYVTISEKVNQFNQYLNFALLDKSKSVNRVDFLSAPGTVNAWYQPELNSISFPIAILQKPFYDPNYPAAVNYGSIGYVGGHELTHAFDDEGVQWGPTGALNTWIDANSSVGFQSMANCVINEYDHFCPLDGGTFCIDGSQTQGENIADNGGIRSSYRAYQAHVALYGQDPPLPDATFSGYTNDQLFFLSFAQVWCQSPPSENGLRRQILVDPHSPSEYRVFGTIQNFPQFRAAFNCPAGAVYAPKEYCQVWTSEVTPVTGIPPTTTTLPPVNIPDIPANNSAQFQEAAAYFEASIDTSKDPCNDFYGYACGNFNNDISFDIADYSDFNITAYALSVPNINDSTSIKKIKQIYAACVTAVTDNSGYLNNGSITLNILNTFLNYTGLQFPLFNSSYSAGWLDSNQLAKVLGYLVGTLQTNTLISSYIDTNWRHPHEGTPYILFVDQPSLAFGWTFYTGLTWNTSVESYREAIRQILNVTAQVMDVQVTENFYLDIEKVTEEILHFEYVLANNFSTDATTRRNSLLNYNPITVAEASANFSFINFTAYIQETTAFADPNVTTKLSQPTYTFIIEEPRNLKNLQSSFVDGNTWGFTPNQIINYLCFRVLWANQGFLNLDGDIVNHDFEVYKPPIGRPRIIRKRHSKRFPSTKDTSYQVRIECAETTLEAMQYANARVFIDQLFPTPTARDNIRYEVGKVAESILIGMRSMVDQISWMSDTSKQGAYYKIDHLVKNIAYPDFIYDDTALDAYYAPLVFSTNGTSVQDFVKLLNDVNKFNAWTQFNYTTFSDTKRDDFNGPPGIVNAWYQPELNSITFPAAILQAPFFDASWPASVNFGAIGVVAGHELTHGFDDEGVQWDGTGVLSTWMDANSSISFKQMAECVIEEYSNFCPLNGITNPDTGLPYSPSCLNGAQTQGENIADNGGIHSAFRAYRNAINFNGPDQRLPGNLVGQFTHDQLFFLSFAQVWCQLPPTSADLYGQILSDPHSPSLYRVWGTLKNYPAFQSAFNCPIGTNYTKTNHCNVWITDIEPATGIPPTTPSTPNLNVPLPQPVNSSSNVSAKYHLYAQMLSNSIDTTRDPCNNFYEYSCGKYPVQAPSISYMQENNFMQMAQAMQVDNAADPKPLQQLKSYYRVCKSARDNWNSLIGSGSQLLGHMQGFENYTGVCFPLFNKNCMASGLSAVELGRALGSLSGQALTDTFVTPFVDTNWKDPQGPHPYVLYVDQPTLANGWIYYTPAVWNSTLPDYLGEIVNLFQRYSFVLNMTYDNNKLENTAWDIMNLELALANTYSTDEITRRNYDRSYNLFTTTTAQKNYSFIDWPTYFRELFVYAQFEVQTWGNMPDFEFVVMETNKTAMLANLFSTYATNATTLYNYLNFRLLLTHSDILTSSTTNTNTKPKTKLTRPLLGRPKHKTIKKKAQKDDDTGNEIQCASDTLDDMQYANGRVYIDWVYPPNGTNRTRLRDSIQKVADSIVVGFRSMIDQIYWMSFATKKGAYDKIDNIVKNIAYPDFIANDTELTDYYQALNSSTTSTSMNDYFTTVEQLKMFNYWLRWNYLNRKTQWRIDFNSGPGVADAWYQPELNSITFPAGILQPPFFDPDFPASVNFGGIGLVSGHELTHGFDDQGVQFDGTGVLLNWMDPQSTVAFKQMAECVVDEYNGFCPLAGVIDPSTGKQYSPDCINGGQTQGENIADNGGIHAAFRAYKSYVDLNGPDPQLPGTLLSQYTQDQLFFLSYGQLWCMLPPSPDDIYQQLLSDVHSPGKYRIQGAIQNFPAFRTAFNCPSNSTYAPQNHCDVWISDIKPPNGTPAPNQVNLPTQPTIKADDPKYPVYKNALDFFRYSMNLSKDPCNNFYDYACGAYNKPLTFSLYREDNQMKMAYEMESLIAKNNTNSTAIKKLLNFYSACKVAQQNISNIIADGSKIRNIIDGFKTFTGLTFPLYEANPNVYTNLPNSTTMAKALAYLSVKTAVDTLVSPFVDVEPIDGNPVFYKIWVDQNTLTYAKSYYHGKTYNITLNTYLNPTITLLKNFTTIMGTNLNDSIISSTAMDFFNLEYTLANSPYSTPDNVRRQFDRWNNPMNFSTANSQFNFIDWPTYINSIFQLTNSPPLVDNNNFTGIFMEVNATQQLSIDIQNVAKFEPNLVINYLFFRIISAYQQFVPQPKNLVPDASINEFTGLGIKSKRNRPQPNIWARKVLDDNDQIMSMCAYDTQRYMQYANARIFTDYLYPDEMSRSNIKGKVGKIIRNILSAFQGMLDQLDWLDLPSKSAAFDKVGNLTINIAYPDFITDDAQLDNYYDQLTFSTNDDYFTMISKLDPFNYYLQYSRITNNTTVDHKDFLGPPGTVNAWYQPELNSITFPEGILRQPYFDPDWPASINYGAMGLVAGHELSHGYDDGGVQYNAFGGLVSSGSWMDPASYANFTQMASCVVKEYGNFTALDCDKYDPCHLNGDNTQGENIADNGGIHSAYRAYRNHIALNGPDPLLPDLVFSQFNHDQLFFLSFAQVWCQSTPTPEALYKQILTDPHSPSLYRIFGTLQNFPAFQTAFNCPLGSAYAPQEHCSVWVPTS